MMPLWLTPKLIKSSILTIIVMSIFFTGFYVRGKLSIAKIVKLKTEIATLNSNYDLCYESLQRSNSNWLGLRDTVDRTNAEVIKQGEEYKARVIQLRAMGRAAISQLNTLHNTAMRDMADEANDLRERMAELSASEACHLAMEEIVK
ncbi:hypothetical protein LCGC14_0344750 [marine sediment metagenome]|uniref:Uncharacterized protein n=1 Tax=marine sediment metagenome TaxID=412755 RepID=A0A0F9TID5_9ZZZZ